LASYKGLYPAKNDIIIQKWLVIDNYIQPKMLFII